jgi:hypothetical protein
VIQHSIRTDSVKRYTGRDLSQVTYTLIAHTPAGTAHTAAWAAAAGIPGTAAVQKAEGSAPHTAVVDMTQVPAAAAAHHKASLGAAVHHNAAAL